MEMTTKEAIPILRGMYNYYNDTSIDTYLGFDKEDNNAIESALDIMSKYQKIEQILDDWTKPEEIEWAIRKVVEDGRN